MTLKALLLMLAALAISSQLSSMNHGGLMIGYSNFGYLPFLGNGSLEFQLGEELWVKAVGRDVSLVLRSPYGLHEHHVLRPGEEKLLKTFSNESDIGDWVLEIADGESMILTVRDPDNEPLTIRYSISGSNLVARLMGSPSAIFMNASGRERLVLIAGWNNRLNASLLLGGDFEGNLPAEILIDVLLGEDLIYEGYLEGIPYRGRFEPMVARVKARMISGLYHVDLPEAHEVGDDGIMPLRLGEATLRLWLNESYSLMRSAYILDWRFREFGGTIADRVEMIPLSGLNQSLRILRADNRGLELIELSPPIALVRILGPREIPLTNISIVASSPVAVINGTAYVLLSEGESFSAHPRSPTRTSIKVYVNGFLAESRDMDLLSGGMYNLSINLKRLTLEIIPPDKETLKKKVHLMINGTSFEHENGRVSYLLPPGTYLIKATAPGFEVSTRLTLGEDSVIKLKLERILRMEDLLKALAAIETICVILLAYANYRGMVPRVGIRIHREQK